MEKYETAIAVFPNHDDAERAVKTLTAAGFDMKNLSVVGKGYHSEEKVVGFYNIGDRIKFWGSRGAFLGRLLGPVLWGVVHHDAPDRARVHCRISCRGRDFSD
jgi:hypothetical protein